MVRCRAVVVWAVLAGQALLAVGSAAGEALSADLTRQYCTACHNDSTRTAGVSLETLDPARADLHPAIWERVLRKVRTGEMPPSDAPSPGSAERSAFVAGLEAVLDSLAAAQPNPGRPPAHRLNRAEYSNAVRDLLHLDVDIRPLLPVDDSGYGFDNIGDVLSLSPALLDRYMFAARRISRLAVGLGPDKPQKDIFVRNRETGFRQAGHAPSSAMDRPMGSERGAALRYYFPATGTYHVAVALDQGDSRTEYEQQDLRLEVGAGMHLLTLTFLGESSLQEHTRPGTAESETRSHPPLDMRLDGKRLELVQLPDGSTPFKIRWISIEGPLEAAPPGATASRRRIFRCRPANEQEELPCARTILKDLARQAYRRPVTDADIDPLLEVYGAGRANQDFETGIAHAIRALLVSPGFLFRIERDPAGVAPATAYRLTDLELASRLSFFLWSSLPDEELLASAEGGSLGDPLELERQVRRMLRDPRASALVENFVGQWLELRKLSRAKPDEILFPEFDADLRFAMRRETELFVDDLLRNNRSVLDLLDSDRTFLNDRLAAHYGIQGVHGAQFREVSLDDARRGGLLGQASILTVTSYPNRTSVVIRGKWVLENLFGMPPPAPPPDIPELEEAAGDTHTLPLRELMSLHSRNPTCASCHVRMDPIGFALEPYDAIGRWRDHDGESPIDASGTLPGNIAFDGPAELRRALKSSLHEEFVGTVVEKLMTYALGRGLEYYDRATVRSVRREAEPARYRIVDLIVGVARSMPFQMRRSASQ